MELQLLRPMLLLGLEAIVSREGKRSWNAKYLLAEG